MDLIRYISQPPEQGESTLALEAFLDTAVYFNRSEDSAGKAVVTGQDVDWPLEAKRIEDQVTLIFYTSADHRRLEPPVASLPLRECIQLSFDFPGADAIALVNADMSWKFFRKDTLEKLMHRPMGGGFR